MVVKKNILSKEENKQREFDHIIEQAEKTFETIERGKDAHPTTLFGREIHTIEKKLENLGKKK